MGSTNTFVTLSFPLSIVGWIVLNALEKSKIVIFTVLPALSKREWACCSRKMIASSTPTYLQQANCSGLRNVKITVRLFVRYVRWGEEEGWLRVLC